MPFLRLTRDRRGYEHTFLLHADTPGQKPRVLHVLGGGCRNQLLNQLTADALGIPVLAGPVEATVMGNILVQATATKDVTGVKEMRAIVRKSAEVVEYTPRDKARWDANHATFQRLAKSVRGGK